MCQTNGRLPNSEQCCLKNSSRSQSAQARDGMQGEDDVGGIECQVELRVRQREGEHLKPDHGRLVVPPGYHRPDRHASGSPDRGLVRERPPDLLDNEAEVPGDVLVILTGLVMLVDDGGADAAYRGRPGRARGWRCTGAGLPAGTEPGSDPAGGR